MLDHDDKQRADLEILDASTVLGERKYSIITGRVMESLSYDATMPVDPLPPEPAWRSMVEMEPPPPPAIPVKTEAFEVFYGALKDAGIDANAARVLLALLPFGLLQAKGRGQV